MSEYQKQTQQQGQRLFETDTTSYVAVSAYGYEPLTGGLSVETSLQTEPSTEALRRKYKSESKRNSG